MKKILLISIVLLLSCIICFAQTSNSKLAECRKIINDINSMELRQVMEYSHWNACYLYFDQKGLIRKYISHYGGESEQLSYISVYNEAGDAIFIAYQAGNNMADEKGFVYLDKGEVVLQNSITYPYYEEWYDDEGNLIVEGEKGDTITKTSGGFSYLTPLFEIPLNQYAHTDSLKAYLSDSPLKFDQLEDYTLVNFSNASAGYITPCNDGIRNSPSMSSPYLEGINTYFIYYITILEKGKGEAIGDWGFNYWYKVKCGDDVGYMYGAFLEPIEIHNNRGSNM